MAGRTLVFTCTDDPAVNAAVAAAGRAAGVWVNSADDPANCTFALPAVARAGRVVVAVGSGGASPALAQHVRDRVAAEILDERLAAAADVLAAERDAIHAAGGSTEGVDWATRLAELLVPPRCRGVHLRSGRARSRLTRAAACGFLLDAGSHAVQANTSRAAPAMARSLGRP